ncbi:MAG: hypothetical protein OXM56_06200, partial [Gammaproteobacteria bacterium]|nr:hypothetical protein [Gammaproteobacteria bacterium]
MREAAIAAMQGFIDAFNAQNHEALADTLNYPHIRLANGAFTEIPTREAFIERSRAGKQRLEAEGWARTTVGKVVAIHVGQDKVHLALTNERRHADGKVYKRFDTFWIATCVDGHWGIQ